MNYLVVSSHPYEGSFNAAVAKTVVETVSKNGHSVECIDLVKDRFNPLMTGQDLLQWRKGQIEDPLVLKYKAAIDKADIVVFPIPLWWASMPAALKGFCDKVFQLGWAYSYGPNGTMIGLLKNKKAVVITTMQTPNDYYNNQLQNPITGSFIKDTLQTCGFEVLKHFQIDQIATGGRAHAEEKLNEIRDYFAQQ
ncbi:NAD(P)H-dependent oxidoreductase [Clostridium tagluense]|uniref:NAD(P)H-dependent oxidoreductase n=1 Tax=Clostridium tagluense TaxID=360422 RepID=UPI001CF0DF7C|nr:NAD(P)H-dependent oxidoreductase [Clostridium tagluense]MCB2312111.1 NAD(P)H-dependent oxidoreductase [Clostridium tagluense]MCB2316704.1 NAD(P)H-dependent oxidoreductase [Clostridium tagluense]MCB2321556.1 NAD(P)H-dependent oxidoreductase [Clostridium tagluense]MCB2326573.1 NAD(P)H-dependent oxidoreductase [Clostridium tagluense]MCB2331296.1 NAD(P)H-dependent oxidoreductase [Clostridium tagluense]